jgi:hypothetical protein
MPFDEAETFTKHNAEPMARWVYEIGGHAGKPKKADAKPKLYISIPTAICGVCKMPKFALLIGTGEDAGKVIVRGIAEEHAKKHHIPPSEHSNFLKFNFGFVPQLGKRSFDGDHVPVKRLDDNNFELTVPASWFEIEDEEDD